MTPDGLFHARRDSQGSTTLVFASRTFRTLAGLDDDVSTFAADDRPIFTNMSDQDYPEFLRALVESESKQKPLRCTFRLKRNENAQMAWLEIYAMPERLADGSVDWFGSLSDVTEHKELVQRIERLAYFDALTDLPNRRLLMNRLGEASKLSGRRRRYGGLMFMDLDGFKKINDTYGHEAGDIFITKIARRLEESLRESDTVARLGGDEFVILLHDLDQDPVRARNDLRIVADKIHANLRRGVELEGVVHSVSGSIGCTLFRGTSVTPELLLRRADKAMYAAKGLGRSRHVFHDDLEAQLDAA
jgi:diguanylate cyclase (GGDEF)-like protein